MATREHICKLSVTKMLCVEQHSSGDALSVPVSKTQNRKEQGCFTAVLLYASASMQNHVWAALMFRLYSITS